ncbi:spore coat protein CotF [Clostridium tetanomorphum]|uniref:Spore coat protein n=1 Tax=Clostridium tetanomorphum TaxID=1553 RepID=A0A923E4N2_CLOTT|nr:spore coat protein [Clostridium tetanomorphum]KAJ50995.1 spore coat protein-like protein [Clostridium tetanomorphum DSM 665]MBC2396362.1 spore coat protein [Clostridium tetanomorphum]MBP1863409.1 spore coat protein CotF [Clostridium tetanomorphum]NRS83506.1 spore coat protein CotF [Clostridium tetanomorphum]NRZ96706.1 spore coat protein CotF [Clostridium tetanomorphum]
MAKIIENMIKNNVNINDKVISANMLSAGKAAADAYLNATLTSSTPELRSIYSASLNQIVGGHSALTELAVNEGWDKPYDSPKQQLTDTYNELKTVINKVEQ